jgi:hypothetical protein
MVNHIKMSFKGISCEDMKETAWANKKVMM